MVRVEISIVEFLKAAISATIDSEFLGMIFLLSRTADGKKLQDELYEGWLSFDDLTGNNILFIVAGTEESRGVSDFYSPVYYASHGLTLKSQTRWKDPWSRNFLLNLPGIKYSGGQMNLPESKESFRAAITNSTSSAAKFFNISEKFLPCILILPTKAGKGVVISFAESHLNFSIYTYLRNLFIESEQTFYKIEQAKENRLKLIQNKKIQQHNLDQAIQRKKNLTLDWNTQKESTLNWLKSAEKNTDYSIVTRKIINWLTYDQDNKLDYIEMANNLIQLIKFREGETLLFHRLNQKLLKVCEKKLSKREYATLENSLQINDIEKEIHIINDNIRNLDDQIYELQSNYSIAEAAEKSANDLSLSKYTGYINRSEKAFNIWELEYYCPQQNYKEMIKYDVAISYASEDTMYAKKIAESLRSNNVSVFYAGFESSTLWGTNLHDFLTDIFENKSQFTIILFSKYYNQKLWTRLERQAVQAAAFINNQIKLLPVMLDESKPEGLLPTVGYLRIWEVGVEGIVSALMEKLNKN